MNAALPFGLPGATAFYLLLYLATFVVHMVFMHYVLAGATYLACGRMMGRSRSAACEWQGILLDWLPFATGLAITAGVAPLLFVQMLYGREFATANLLLSHRWMAILPVLIICFYLLYLQKSGWIGRRPWVWRPVVAVAVCAGFLFIALGWTENHLLMLDRAAWPGLYASGGLRYDSPGLLPRLAVWFFLAFPSLAIELAWQGRLLAGRGKSPPGLFPGMKTSGFHGCRAPGTSSLTCGRVFGHSLPGVGIHSAPPPGAVVAGLSPLRRLAVTAGAGLIGCCGAAVVYWSTLPPAVRELVAGPLAGPWLVVLGGALAVQAAAWSLAAIRDRLPSSHLVVATGAWVVGLVAVAMVREAIRLSAVDLAASAASLAAALRIGGLPVFLAFALVNAAAIAWCIRLVRAAPDRP
jgi:hypothetical protein